MIGTETERDISKKNAAQVKPTSSKNSNNIHTANSNSSVIAIAVRTRGQEHICSK